MKTTLFIPVLNEIEGLKVIMPRIKKEWVDEVLIIDGHSTDGSREYLEGLGYVVKSQTLPKSMGAWWEGFEAATGDVIIPFSPDGNTVPEKIPELVAKIKEGYDMVIASRYLGNAKSEDDSALSRLGNWVFTKLVNFLFGGRYTDVLVMFRAFRKDLLRRFGFNKDTCSAFNKHKVSMYEILLSIKCAKDKLRVTEISADEPKRVGKDESRIFKSFPNRLSGAFTMLYYIIHELLV